jgi:hypothetical protein
MRACFARKVLPLTLCFAVGVGLAAAGELTSLFDLESSESLKTAGAPASRAWLVVQAGPPLSFSETLNANAGPHFVRLRAKFGADGTVSEITELSSSVSKASIAEAVGAARRMKFSPATEDGIPLDVIVEVNFEPGAMHAMGVDRNGRRFCVSSVLPARPSVNIVSVPGATNSEGWRVVHE